MGCDQVQYFEVALDAVGWKFNGHGKCDKGPTQDQLPCGPCGITFAHFLQRCLLLVMRVVTGFQASEDSIHGMQKRSLNMLSMYRSTLDHVNEIFAINVPLLHSWQWTAVRHRRSGQRSRCWAKLDFGGSRQGGGASET
jgi:hypothetical protein